MNKKFELSITQVWNINQHSSVLRSFSGFNIDLANKINSISIGLMGTIKQINLTDEILNEKRADIIKMADGEEKTKANKLFNEDYIKENKKKFKVDLPVLKKEEFIVDGKHIEITGVKEVDQQNGETKKFIYRDAYHELVKEGLIVE